MAIAGGDRKISIREALIRRLRDRALAGSKRALALQHKFLKLAEVETRDASLNVDLIAASGGWPKWPGSRSMKMRLQTAMQGGRQDERRLLVGYGKSPKDSQ